MSFGNTSPSDSGVSYDVSRVFESTYMVGLDLACDPLLVTHKVMPGLA
jgi:hypothetical protein